MSIRLHHDPRDVKLRHGELVIENRVWQGPAGCLPLRPPPLHDGGFVALVLDVMTRKEFRRLVTDVLENLPADIASRIENVEVVVEDEPTDAQIRSVGLDPLEDTLFGLYEGVPLSERGHEYAALPDKISVFYLPIVEACSSTAEIRDEIRTTVLHEVAHFFGIDDDDLDDWGY